MDNTCSICGGKLDALFPLLGEHPQHKICSTCSIQKTYIVDAANRNDAAAFKEAADAFRARTYVGTSPEVKADMEVIIKRFEGMLLDEPQDAQPGDEENSDMLNVPVTLGGQIEGHRILKYCGTVGANAVILIDALKPGHESSVHIAKLNNRQQMLIQAKGLGANALINHKVDYVTLNDRYLLVANSADAVQID